jgi:hypothetical protein
MRFPARVASKDWSRVSAARLPACGVGPAQCSWCSSSNSPGSVSETVCQLSQVM